MLRFNVFSRLLHWLIAAMIVLQYVSIQLAERAEEAGVLASQISYIGSHKSVGMTILLLAVLRLLWRLVVGRPTYPLTMPLWQVKFASMTHAAFYLLLFAIPITGWLGSSAATYSVSWFGVFTFPDLVGANPDLKEALFEVHEVLGITLFFLALLHIAAALKHYFKDKDLVLQSMLSWMGAIIFIVVIAAGVLMLKPADKAVEVKDSATKSSVAGISGAVSTAATDISTLEAWQLDYANSYIRFSGEQLGAAFSGAFDRWQASIQFDAEKLDSSSMRVDIDLTSVTTRDAERDGTILSEAFFDADNWPQAMFYTNTFIANAENGDQRFSSRAELTLKNLTTPVAFHFNVARDEQGRQVLRGVARLDRLAMNVGTGEWSSTESIGQYVDVEVQVMESIL